MVMFEILLDFEEVSETVRIWLGLVETAALIASTRCMEENPSSARHEMAQILNCHW